MGSAFSSPDRLKMRVFLALFSCIAAASASTLLQAQWSQFKADHAKVYSSPAEEALRLSIFAKNVAKINEQNRAGQSWKSGINQFTDLTKEEFVSTYASGKIASRAPRKPVNYDNLQAKIADLPESVDWRDQGVVTMVRNQGACGSCWAFASASVLGSYAKINNMTHDLIELSPQHLVSCVPNPLKCGGTGGCMGSIEPLAYTYASLFGIVTEDDYPYASGSGGNDDVCEFDATTTDATVMTMGFETLPHNDAAALMNHLATAGPLSASVAASDWSAYHGGVFDGCDYNGNMVVNHAVTLVGYGTDPAEGDFWLIKNSWGTSWGEGGYIRLRRQSTPQCAIDSSPLDGSGCVDGGVESVEVCGTCAVVSDNSYPLGTTFMF